VPFEFELELLAALFDFSEEEEEPPAFVLLEDFVDSEPGFAWSTSVDNCSAGLEVELSSSHAFSAIVSGKTHPNAKAFNKPYFIKFPSIFYS
jgi:hypothetical protein